MPANYLHGVEFIKLDNNPKPIRLVKSAVIGIVGAAPMHLLAAADRTINSPLLILSDIQAMAKCGPATAGFSLPENLELCQLLGAATIIAVNVFDMATHKTAVAAEVFTLDADRKYTVDFPGFVAPPVIKNTAGDTTFVLDTDYTYDAATGIITGIGATLIAAYSGKVDYDYADPSKITSADIIGGVNELGERTGMSAWQDARNLYGFSPRILIAPGYSSLETVAAALRTHSAKLRAVNYIDAPIGTTVEDAITCRGPLGDINFYTSDGRTQLFFPSLLIGSRLVAYSAVAAGMRAYIDIEEGYWVSLSNHEIPAITGIELPITADILDSTTEANLLNEVGITTVFAGFGTGYRTWGNRLASWPSESGIETFEVTVRVDDVIMDSLAGAMLQFMDRPLNMALLDALTESERGFLRTMAASGAIIDGNCWYTITDNPTAELQMGHVTLHYDFCNGPPLERLTHKRSINLGYLNQIFKGGA